MRICITGGSGLVGSAICKFLQDEFEIHYPTHNELDLENFIEVSKYFKKNNFDCVIHAAGFVGGIGANCKNNYEFFLKNLEMGKNVVISANESGIKKLVNIGSSCIYPSHFTEPIKEECLFDGKFEKTNEGYSLAKASIIKLISFINHQHGRNYKSIIPCNLYGPNDNFNESSSHLIPAIILKTHNALKNKEKSIEIWGDGMAKREFMFVSDLAEFINIFIKKYEIIKQEFVNVGNGFDCSINEYYNFIADILGYSGNFVNNLSKPSGMQRKLLDVSFQKSFGWEPKVSLEKGINLTYEYFLTYEQKI